MVLLWVCDVVCGGVAVGDDVVVRVVVGGDDDDDDDIVVTADIGVC